MAVARQVNVRLAPDGEAWLEEIRLHLVSLGIPASTSDAARFAIKATYDALPLKLAHKVKTTPPREAHS
jgi:hypothetical protein